VVSLEFQCRCLALRSPAINTGDPSLRHLVKGRVGGRYTATTLTGQFANTVFMAVASRCCRPETGTA